MKGEPDQPKCGFSAVVVQILDHLGVHFAGVDLLGLFHARKLRVHELAIKLGWDSVHKRLGLTKPFYDRFTPAIAASDFRLRESGLDRALDFLAVCHTA